MTTGKTIALIIWTFVSKVMFLLFNTLSRFVIVFLPRSKHLSMSWLQSLSPVILDTKQIKSPTPLENFLKSQIPRMTLLLLDERCGMGHLGSLG